MSTLNKQCQYCYRTTSVTTVADGSDAYEYEASGNCGCDSDRQQREEAERAFDYDD